MILFLIQTIPKEQQAMSRLYSSGRACLAKIGGGMHPRHVAPSPCAATGAPAAWTRSFATALFRAPASPFKASMRTIPRKGDLYSTASLNTTSLGNEDRSSTVSYKNLQSPSSIAATHFDLSQIDPSEHSQILRDFIIIPAYLSPTEHDMLMEAATKKLKRALGKQVRYEDGHFDGVITRYRECSATDWGSGPESTAAGSLPASSQSSAGINDAPTPRPERTSPQEIMHSIKQEFFPHHWKWVAPHILELESGKGGIKPHVDHLDASGEVVAGLCLGSTAVMELIHETDPNKQFKVLLPKGCFYFQRDGVRYHYKHGIPILKEDHHFKGIIIPKERRISVMLRNALDPSVHGGQTGNSSYYRE